uniref:MARVEL domain-containing protein n=1 Tax=Anser brachyrhynchus TaxID=132585 RepID=A0A8B9C790_9AVES
MASCSDVAIHPKIASLVVFFFSIFAFATCGGYSGKVSYWVSCNGKPNVTVTVPFGYPFRLNQAVFSPPTAELCNKTEPGEVHLVGDFSSSAQFFVTVAVFAFLYSMAALAVYLGYFHLYRGAGGKLPLADFLATVAFSFLWLVSTSAWAKALTDVKISTGAPLPNCNGPHVACYHAGVSPMGSLNVSVVVTVTSGPRGGERSPTLMGGASFPSHPRPPVICCDGNVSPPTPPPPGHFFNGGVVLVPPPALPPPRLFLQLPQ